MTARPVLVTGISGFLAPYVARAMAALGPVVTTGRADGDERADLTDDAAVSRLMERVAPGYVVNAAAFADVDGCEADPDRAMAANTDIVVNIVRALPTGCRLIQISTDQVYPDTPGPHGEDVVGPVNAYGRSKLAGEVAALAHPETTVLRTNFFGPAGDAGKRSLSDFVIDSLRAGRAITLFSDVLFSPLHVETLAGLCRDVADRNIAGVFNAGCREGASKADFGLAVAEMLGLPTETVTVGPSSSLSGRAPRPMDLRMNSSRLESALDTRLDTLQQEIKKLGYATNRFDSRAGRKVEN